MAPNEVPPDNCVDVRKVHGFAIVVNAVPVVNVVAVEKVPAAPESVFIAMDEGLTPEMPCNKKSTEEMA